MAGDGGEEGEKVGEEEGDIDGRFATGSDVSKEGDGITDFREREGVEKVQGADTIDVKTDEETEEGNKFARLFLDSLSPSPPPPPPLRPPPPPSSTSSSCGKLSPLSYPSSIISTRLLE